jgi:hypothetical protein
MKITEHIKELKTTFGSSPKLISYAAALKLETSGISDKQLFDERYPDDNVFVTPSDLCEWFDGLTIDQRKEVVHYRLFNGWVYDKRTGAERMVHDFWPSDLSDMDEVCWKVFDVSRFDVLVLT